MIQSDKRPHESNFTNITDYSLKCPEGLRRFYAFIHFTDESTCLWSNIFTKTRSEALAQVLKKFSDSTEYISSINLHEDDN